MILFLEKQRDELPALEDYCLNGEMYGIFKTAKYKRKHQKLYKQRIHEIFKTAEITEENLVFFKYLKTALTQVKQSKSYCCVAISNRVEYMKYLGYE